MLSGDTPEWTKRALRLIKNAGCYRKTLASPAATAGLVSDRILRIGSS